MGIFDFFKRKHEKVTNELLTNSITNDFKTGDKILYKYFNKPITLQIYNDEVTDGLTLTQDEINEVNWLLKSNLLENATVQSKILSYINKVYEQYEENFYKRTNIENEIDLNSVIVRINDDSKIVAFCGNCKCDEEHGISISFKNRQFMAVQPEAEYYYDPQPKFDYSTWKDNNPLMGMIPKFADVLINNNLTDSRNICFFNQVYYGTFTEQLKQNLPNLVAPSNISKSNLFNRCAITIKNDDIFIINFPYGKNLEDYVNKYQIVSKSQVVKCFILTDSYKIDETRTNYFASLHLVLNNGNIVIFGDMSNKNIMALIAKEFGNL